jgi:hypothetical protein
MDLLQIINKPRPDDLIFAFNSSKWKKLTELGIYLNFIKSGNWKNRINK